MSLNPSEISELTEFPTCFAEGGDSDGDSICDNSDNCPDVSNPGQEDCDSDGTGDVCETNSDNDGIPDDCDNCPERFNPAQTDWDNDGLGDTCDTETQDKDGDGVDNRTDNCESALNFYQLDADSDGIGDVCDSTPGCGGCGQSACEQ